MKIGIYGGTFNPIHLGHMEAARFALEYLQLDKLLLIPAGIPPHKTMSESAPTPEQRLAMADLAAQAIGAAAEASDMELRREGKSYTLDTLRGIREAYPHAKLYLLMGTDMFLSFHLWREPEKIMRLCTLCAFGRSENDRPAVFDVQRTFLQEKYGAEIITLSLPRIVDISSTRLREELRQGRGVEYLDPAVYGFILRESLYGMDRDVRNLSLDDLRYAALSMLKHTRVRHVLGTEEAAAKLALRWGVDEETARRTALLHDCTKKLNGEQHRALIRQYDIQLSEDEKDEVKLFHAITGAAVAKHVFGVSPAVESAIRWHTTGKADMNTLEKIIYLADYIEPNRDFCDLTELRRLAYEDLDRAMLLALSMAVEDLRGRGVSVDTNSLQARDYLKGKLA